MDFPTGNGSRKLERSEVESESCGRLRRSLSCYDRGNRKFLSKRVVTRHGESMAVAQGPR